MDSCFIMNVMKSTVLVWLLSAFAFVWVRAEDVPKKTHVWNHFAGCELIANKSDDGDSFKVKVGAEEHWFRLAFVDSPEADVRFLSRNEEQARYFGISTNEVVVFGKEASDATAKLLAKPFTVWTRWASALGSTRLPRFTAFVELSDGRDLGETLLSMGLARVKGIAMNSPKGEKMEVYREKLEKLEVEAKAKHLGIWAKSKRTP